MCRINTPQLELENLRRDARDRGQTHSSLPRNLSSSSRPQFEAHGQESTNLDGPWYRHTTRPPLFYGESEIRVKRANEAFSAPQDEVCHVPKSHKARLLLLRKWMPVCPRRVGVGSVCTEVVSEASLAKGKLAC
ncbi:uncharacterized protein LOC100899769 isoform X1 [Galendromus occidentalis]|uniref:Uncharacterized protein LOC100899769 isoform X1 n=1 Tax=Galendromus occidentalis TaxID=34638 RepID=A0AAJ6W0H3_9ACAR|nr:uncharacterized protein LOC100899769 isoform X1 [Galendromus occidentalis]